MNADASGTSEVVKDCKKNPDCKETPGNKTSRIFALQGGKGGYIVCPRQGQKGDCVAVIPKKTEPSGKGTKNVGGPVTSVKSLEAGGATGKDLRGASGFKPTNSGVLGIGPSGASGLKPTSVGGSVRNK